jgi:NAD(P)-dependent dehydrogenase (short-subunit alcohol dehydrogenase family)
MSKTLLNAVTAILAAELGGTIAVNSVCPGWVKTDMGGRGAPRDDSGVARARRAGDADQQVRARPRGHSLVTGTCRSPPSFNSRVRLLQPGHFVFRGHRID